MTIVVDDCHPEPFGVPPKDKLREGSAEKYIIIPDLFRDDKYKQTEILLEFSLISAGLEAIICTPLNPYRMVVVVCTAGLGLFLVWFLLTIIERIRGLK